ncbi:excisionase family DNA-binding protein [Streptomyces sp. NPDC005955]|uniref:excisionase family DNA-binding protein n=1 Tax=Streptomyces sp. NPDC005955 TaxID=3364738 RepID=UPI00369FE1E5
MGTSPPSPAGTAPSSAGPRFPPRRLIEERRIRYVKLGRPVRIPESAVEEFFRSRTVQPVRRPRPCYGRAAA